MRSAVIDAQEQAGEYVKTADTAIDLASVDPNTGVAAMQDADTAYKNLTGTVGGLVARIDALTTEGSAASRERSNRAHLLRLLVGVLAAGAAVAVLAHAAQTGDRSGRSRPAGRYRGGGQPRCSSPQRSG